MKIVNLISIDIESAAASDVANNAAKTRLEFHLFDFTLPPSLAHWESSFDSLLFTTIDGHVFFAAVRPRTISSHNGPLTPSSKVD